MYINPVLLAKRVFEEVTYDLGPCLYPGGFKPPHKGHFEALKDLASRNYIDEVHVIISQKDRDGITAQQSLETWKTYLECDPIPKAQVLISPYPSPVTYAYKFVEARPTQKPIYVAGGKDEVESQNYFESLQKRFGDQVLSIAIDEKFGRVSASEMRLALRTGNYEKFKELVPEAVNLKGKTQELFKSLASTIKENHLPQDLDPRIVQIQQFLSYCYNLLEITEVPDIEVVEDPMFPKENHTFGSYNPGTCTIQVYITNRNLADILRTLAHELIHHKQNELGLIELGSGNTGSDIENEANASAAMILREYGKRNPEIYE